MNQCFLLHLSSESGWMDSFILESCGLDPKLGGSICNGNSHRIVAEIFRIFSNSFSWETSIQSRTDFASWPSALHGVASSHKKSPWSTQHPRRDSFPVELLALQYVLLLCKSQVSRFRELRSKFGNGRTLKKSLCVSLACISC